MKRRPRKRTCPEAGRPSAADAVKKVRDARLALRPPLTAARLASWEEARGFQLPDEYRVLLLELGDGGAGPPPTGVWPLEELSDLLFDWTRSASALEDMSRPFPLEEAWIWGDEERAREGDLGDREWTRQLRDGLLYLGSDPKRPVYWALVVTGPARGQVWLIDHSPEGGKRYVPVAPDVLSWYVAWLDSGDVDRTIPAPRLTEADLKPRKKRRTRRPRRLALDAYLARLSKVYEAEGVELALNRGATRGKIARYETSLGFEVSPALVELWQNADGTGTPMFARPGVLCGHDLLTIDESRRQRGALAKRAASSDGYEQEEPRDARIQPAWYDDGWVPFAGFGGGSMLLLEDHAPTREGKRGQIIAYVHDPDEIVYVADSLASFLPASLQAIEDDPYEVGISTDNLG